jgi:hypothetical protein
MSRELANGWKAGDQGWTEGILKAEKKEDIVRINRIFDDLISYG